MNQSSFTLIKKTNMLKNIFIFLFVILITSCATYNRQENTISPDILIVGGSTSGISAAISSARMGVSTLLIEESEWLGGMLTSAGVSAIDGNYNLPSGFWGEFKDSLVNHYGSSEAINTGWVSNVLFEPSVGNKILKKIAQREKKLTIHFNTRLKSIKKINKKWIVEIVDKTSQRKRTVYPRVVIDATELGDVALSCGVKYDVGMESKVSTGEDIAPEKENNVIQDLTYVAILKDYGKDVTIEKPAGYDPAIFACACENILCETPNPKRVLWSKEKMLTYGKLPNNKYMINWPIQGNDYYLNLIAKTEEERVEALKKAKNHTLCFLYFVQKELGMNTLGLADDEYPTDDKLPFIPYHRESLRIHGLVRFTLNHITDPYNQPEKLYRTSIAVGDYPVDHHHDRYPNYEELPSLHFHSIPSFGVPLGVMIPKDVEEMIVAEKSISVSNIVNGATRLQPVVMQIGQAAGILAALSIKQNTSVDNIAVREVQRILLSQGSYLLPYLDVEKDDILFLPLQRIGVTGILRGVGKNEGWANQTWFRANDKVLWSELIGIQDIYPSARIPMIDTPLMMSDMLSLIKGIAEKEKLPIDGELDKKVQMIYAKFGFPNYNDNRQLTRAEAAVLIDQFLNPFEKEINIKGHFKN